MPVMRLDRFLANAGCGTRSEVKQLLKKGMVTVNCAVVRQSEYKVNTDMDSVLCNGKEIRLSGLRYFLLNKPAGYLSATEDRHQGGQKKAVPGGTAGCGYGRTAAADG